MSYLRNRKKRRALQAQGKQVVFFPGMLVVPRLKVIQGQEGTRFTIYCFKLIYA